jgi:AmmeMemoRadiSam system protein B/AmmeMemoRadiSam system protein A
MASPAETEILSLNDEQKSTIHRAASELFAAAVLNLPARLSNRDLAGAGNIKVIGAFTSIKRQDRLRSCCGFLGEETNIAEAIEKAAERTATDDQRFPRVSPLELPYVELETWLLHSPKLIEAKGHDRAAAVEIGKHGLQVARGNNRGLLLPGVATEAKFTPEQFLQQVCMKAGLPPSLWTEDETQLWTFEGLEFGGPLEAGAAKEGALQPGVPYPGEILDRIAKACADNIFLLYRGATASYVLNGCPDGNVAGLALFVNEPGKQETMEISKMSMRPLMPLQSSLFMLCQGAAAALKQRASTMHGPQALNLAIAILFDPVMHGTVAAPDLRGFDPSRRALLVAESQNNAWMYDPDKSPEQLLEEAAKAAKVTTPESAGVFSLGICSTGKPLVVVRTVEPQIGPTVRGHNLAGRFYPADKDELSAAVDKLLEGPTPRTDAWPAVMVPHAGLQYSGQVAADALRRVKFPSTVIVLCPKHTPLGVEWAVAPNEEWALPTGDVKSDPALAKQLAEAIDGLELDGAAHHMEHAIEVELPLIQRLAPQAKVVGIAIGGGTYARLEKFAEGLANVLADRQDDVLFVISSDMNHFAADEENRRLDEEALAALESLDPKQAFDTIMDKRISMCGIRPAVIVMETLKRWNRLNKAVRTGYATTADTTGDKSRVVGYAGMLLG